MTEQTADVDTDDGPTIRPFADVLQDLRRGGAHIEASEALHQLIAAVKETGKSGTLTIVLAVKPVAKNDGDTVTVTDSVRLKAPQQERTASVFFVDGDCNLRRDNPAQMHLPLREVPTAPETPIREANAR